jgi:hypothetical protein
VIEQQYGIPVHNHNEGEAPDGCISWNPSNDTLGPITLHLSERDIPYDDGFGKSDFGMIMHKNCNLIVKTSSIWLPELMEASKNFAMPLSLDPRTIELWKSFERVWKIMDYTEEAVKNAGINDYAQERNELQFFADCFRKIYGVKYRGTYLHIVLCHTIPVRLPFWMTLLMFLRFGLLMSHYSSSQTRALNRAIITIV